MLKKIFHVKLLSLEEIEAGFYSKDIWHLFLKNSNKLKDNKTSKLFWDIGVSNSNFQHHYHSFVIESLDNYKKSEDVNILVSLWETKHEDIEFIYNLQRMYKFSEIMNTLNFSDNNKLNVIVSWINKFPPKKGVAWMGFNCSIRLINWVKILNSFKNNSIKENDIKIIILSIFQNLEFITKNFEHHIPGNHVIFQYFSVWLITFLFEDERVAKFSKLFSTEFEEEFLENGLHFELSTHYHLQVLQLGVYFSLINFYKNKIPSTLFAKIEKAYIVLESFSFTPNYLPLIGDNCYNFFHNNLIEDAENLNYLKKILDLEEKTKKETIELDDEYIIVSKGKSKLIFDVGRIGMKQNPGHGHSDILSINYSYDGIPIFVDPGTRRYSNLQENLELKRANLHNTLAVNGEDQSILWGFFRWAFLPERTIYNYKKVKKSVILKASFIGFKNIGGAKHSRTIEISDLELNILDTVQCEKITSVEQNFILSEFVTIKQSNSKYYLIIDNAKFEFEVDSEEEYTLEVIPQKIYTSYDNPIDSSKIGISYKTLNSKFKTNIKLKLINEKN